MATKKIITNNYGSVIVRNAMFEEENGTDLYEGIELKDEEGNIIEVRGYRDIDEMDSNDVETLIENI